MAYVDTETIKSFAEAADESPDTVWTILAASASLIFDRAAKVEEGFFAPAPAYPFDKFFNYEPSGYYRMPPFLPPSNGDDGTGGIIDPNHLPVIIEFIVFLNQTSEVIDPANYQIKDGYLYFANTYFPDFFSVNYSTFNVLTINARWGFAATPADIQQAVIEQALFMFRRKDLAFTDLSGVSTAAIAQQLSPTCAFVAEKYREKYQDFSI